MSVRAHVCSGSVFYCKQAPPVGAATAFADMRAAYDSLTAAQQMELEHLETVCSLHHHDTKIYRLTNDDQLPAQPLLTEEQRRASPPTRHPLVLPHPQTGRKALYGLNSSTCVIVPKGTPVAQEDIDEYDYSGREDPSCMIWRELLQKVTTPKFALLWQWTPGDLLLWVSALGHTHLPACRACTSLLLLLLLLLLWLLWLLLLLPLNV